eukprot:437577_1
MRIQMMKIIIIKVIKSIITENRKIMSKIIIIIIATNQVKKKQIVFFEFLSDLNNVDDCKLKQILSTFSSDVFIKMQEAVIEFNQSMQRISSISFSLPQMNDFMFHRAIDDNGYSTKSESISSCQVFKYSSNRNRTLIY